MNNFLAEMIGTTILIFLGNGVTANISLNKSAAKDSGWLVLSFGWALAVITAVFIVGPVSGAYFNPAITISKAIIGKFPWNEVPIYLLAQFIGSFLGAVLVFIFFYPHYKETDDKAIKLATFATAPSIRSIPFNFLSEFIGTFLLTFSLIGINNTKMLDGLAPYSIGVVVLALGVCLGGTTGYAANPARDLAPRIAHALLPVPNKGDSDWSYAWIPVVAPILGGILGAVLANMFF